MAQKIQLADTLPLWKARSTWAFLIAASTLLGFDVTGLLGVDNAAVAAQTISSGITAITEIAGIGSEKTVSPENINHVIGAASVVWGMVERLNPGKRLVLK